MSDKSPVDTLRQFEFFQNIPEPHLEKLAALAEEVDFPTHKAIFRENEEAKDVYLVVSGSVSLAICDHKVGCRQLAKAGPGEMVGWSPMLGRPRLSDTATATSPTKAFRFDGQQLVQLCDDNPELGYQFMRRTAQVLAQRLGAARLEMLSMCGINLPQAVMETD